MKTLSKISIPKAQLLPGGAMREFALTQILHGHVPVEAGDNMEYMADMSKQQPTFDELKDMVVAGVYFENIKLGIELTGTGAQLEVPAIVPGSTYVDEDEQTQTRTWVQWVKSQPNIRAMKKIGENLYIIKAIYGGKMLNSKQLTAAHGQLGVNVIEWSVVQFRVASEEWEEFKL